MITNCKRCGTEIEYDVSKRGRPREFCMECAKKNRSDYYCDWYRKNGRNRHQSYSQKVMEWKRKNPEKVAAHKIVAQAMKDRLLVNPGQCSKCGTKTGYLDAHHEDYSRPLSIRWLCPACHHSYHHALRKEKP